MSDLLLFFLALITHLHIRVFLPDVLGSLDLWCELADIFLDLLQSLRHVGQSRQGDVIGDLGDLRFYFIQSLLAV